MTQPAAAWQDEARRVAHGIRRRVLEHTLNANGGYLSQACSSAELLATLYTRVMRLGPSVAPVLPPAFSGVPGPGKPGGSGALYHGAKAPDTDRFIISPAHYALAVYAALIEMGRLDPDALRQFNQDGSSVEMIGGEHSPGMEVTSGSFGQSLSQAAGIAEARRRRGDSGHVWVFLSDGELQEGQTWEAIQAIAFHQIDNLTVYVDVNDQQVDGRMRDVMNIEPIAARLEAFGALVCPVDGHDVEALAAPADIPREGKPLFVLAYTDAARGIDLLEARKPLLHYVRFKDDAEREHYRAYLAAMEG